MNDNVTQELAPEDDPKNYEPRREDGRPDLTFCETFFGYPEAILADILRKENVSETIIAKIESDEPHSITEEERTEIENSVTTAEETGKVPQDINIMAYYNRMLGRNYGEEGLKKLVGYGYEETRAALHEYRHNPELRVNPDIIIFPERLTAIEKAKIRTILRYHYWLGEQEPAAKPELWNEYVPGEVVGEGFRRVPIWARAILQEGGYPLEGKNLDKMPIDQYVSLMMDIGSNIPGFEPPLSCEDLEESSVAPDLSDIDEVLTREEMEEYRESLKYGETIEEDWEEE